MQSTGEHFRQHKTYCKPSLSWHQYLADLHTWSMFNITKMLQYKKILVILHGHAGSSSRTTSLAGDLRLRLRASLRASRANLASHPPPAKPRRVTRRNSSLRRIRGHPMRKKHLAGALELPRLLSPWQMKARRCQASVNGERGPEHQWDWIHLERAMIEIAGIQWLLYIYIYLFIYFFTFTYIYIYIYIYSQLYIYIYIHIYIYIYSHLYIYIYIFLEYVYIYI